MKLFFMERKQKEQIIIVVTIIALVLMFIGISYAYFTSVNNERSGSSIVAVGGKMLINYNDGTDDIKPVTNIKPSNAILVDKTFTLTGTNTTKDLTMPYKVGLKYTSTFSDGMMHYYIKEVNRPANSSVTTNYVIKPEEGKTKDDYINQTVPGNASKTGYVHGTLKNGNKYTEMVTGEFSASTNDQTITFNLILQFPDNNENQDSEKGATINGKVVVNYEPKYISTYLTKLDLTDNGLEVDDTTDKNIRYVGASPKNYLKFNGETWRIIGVFNNITTIDKEGNETKESLVKIVRNDSLGDYSWDTSESTKNYGYGVNEWSQADLMTELNTDYINQNPPSPTTKWYNGQNNAKDGSYDYSKNIKSSSLDKVANVRWNLGGYNAISVSALNIYNAERGTAHISNPSDGTTRKNTWDGKIALIYPSDYGYASTDRACRDSLSSSTNNVYNCKNENWLFNSAFQWTMSSSSDSAYRVIFIYSGGRVVVGSAHYPYGVRPALFLKSDVVISGGTGESVEKSYTLE